MNANDTTARVATLAASHGEECLCTACMMADMDSHLVSAGVDATAYAVEATATAERTRYATPGQACGRGVVRKASHAQVEFIKNLLRTRDTRNLTRLPGGEDVDNISLKGATDLIERLLSCPEIPAMAAAANLATPAQVKFAASLAAERGVPADTFATLTRKEISKTIDMLKGMPRIAAPTTPAEAPEVPEGRYAIEVDGVVKFYKVDRPTEGKWAGYVFVKVQASDDTFPIRNREAKAAILATIAKDPKEAMLRYGREIGACGHCGRTLTDEASRARGIGPICAGKV